MAIITVAETKTLLGLTDHARDAIIEFLIPIVRDNVVGICNNYFLASGIDVGYVDTATDEGFVNTEAYRYMGEGIYSTKQGALYIFDSMDFSAGSNTIQLRNLSSFETEGFADGQEVYVYNSYMNDGYYESTTVTTDTLTLASAGASVYAAENEVEAELSGASIFVSVVRWEIGLKPTVANMIRYEYENRPREAGVRSKSLGPWSESYGDQRQAYPDRVVAGLAPFMKEKVQ